MNDSPDLKVTVRTIIQPSPKFVCGESPLAVLLKTKIMYSSLIKYLLTATLYKYYASSSTIIKVMRVERTDIMGQRGIRTYTFTRW